MADAKKLTSSKFWEDYWTGKADKGKPFKFSLLMQEVLEVFNNDLPADPSLSILEIGGAPGNYLLYLKIRFGYQVYSLDYSAVGNEQTKATFDNAGESVTLFERDLYKDLSDLPKFDIVYSLGFIEHFDDPTDTIQRHLDLLKPGGILLLGIPNLTGIYHIFLKRLSPSHDKTHNLQFMNLENWRGFEQKFGLKKIFREYIGGFEPLVMKKLDEPNFINYILNFFVKILMVIFSFKMKFLRKFNSRYWSGFMIGIYQKPL